MAQRLFSNPFTPNRMKQPAGGGGTLPGSAPSPTMAPAGCSTQSSTARRNLVKPFAVASQIAVAAGAQAINTDLFDAFDAANVDFIGTNNVFPYDVQTFGICSLISTGLAATYIETQAVILGLYWVESDQTGELARWPVLSTGIVAGTEGVVTTGAVADASYYGPEVFTAWERYYPNGSTQSLAIRTTTAFTSVAPINFGASFVAKR